MKTSVSLFVKFSWGVYPFLLNAQTKFGTPTFHFTQGIIGCSERVNWWIDPCNAIVYSAGGKKQLSNNGPCTTAVDFQTVAQEQLSGIQTLDLSLQKGTKVPPELPKSRLWFDPA